MGMLDFIKRLFSRYKLFSRHRNRGPICRFSVLISVDRDDEKYKNLKNLIGTDNTVDMFSFATDIKYPGYIINSENIISNILNYPTSLDMNEEIIRFKENIKKYKDFEDLLNSSNEIIVEFGFKYFSKLLIIEDGYVDKNHVYYTVIIDNKENRIAMMNKENIGIRLEEVTMRMMYEFGSFKKQFDSYKEFYRDIRDISKAIMRNQIEDEREGWY